MDLQRFRLFGAPLEQPLRNGPDTGKHAILTWKRRLFCIESSLFVQSCFLRKFRPFRPVVTSGLRLKLLHARRRDTAESQVCNMLAIAGLWLKLLHRRRAGRTIGDSRPSAEASARTVS